MPHIRRILPNINRKEVSELTAIAPQGDLLWVGTKSGALLLMDVVKIRSLIPEVEQKWTSQKPERMNFNRQSILGTAVSSPINSPPLCEVVITLINSCNIKK